MRQLRVTHSGFCSSSGIAMGHWVSLNKLIHFYQRTLQEQKVSFDEKIISNEYLSKYVFIIGLFDFNRLHLQLASIAIKFLQIEFWLKF